MSTPKSYDGGVVYLPVIYN
ncbi:predicted protein [Fibroporia radiculosa]|uniref:Uncharacterized protein n=1 Tax=Fibroporia radiculosa TaxID=599839 RepID=J4H4Y8_9APHY|nr:predicted protein [Fibroporia radiculosa]